MAFISRTRPSKDVFRISGGVCSGNVSLKCAEEYSLQSHRTMNFHKPASCTLSGIQIEHLQSMNSSKNNSSSSLSYYVCEDVEGV